MADPSAYWSTSTDTETPRVMTYFNWGGPSDIDSLDVPNCTDYIAAVREEFGTHYISDLGGEYFCQMSWNSWWKNQGQYDRLDHTVHGARWAR